MVELSGTIAYADEMTQQPSHLQLMNFASAKWISKPLWVVAHLNIADLLAKGPKTVGELARQTSAHEPSLYRILRALACVGVFTESSPRTFALTPLASPLRSDVPDSVRDVVVFVNHPVHDQAWTEILFSVQTGKPAFDKALGKPIFEYFQSNPEFSEVFNRAMTSLSKNRVTALAESYDFSGIKALMDVGGGHGALLSAILDRHPQMKGIVFDVPHVVEGAKKALKNAGKQSQCEVIAGDFFKEIPSADAIILSHIIHDWDDERCTQILKNCRKALPPHGKVLICEAVVPPGDQFSPAKLLDIEMLVMPGGKERTEQEYRTLLEGAGFKLNRIVPTRSAASVIEGYLS